jgi:16S rRNA (adenine1518-N6/adenine1519-N6)-dimethyltransferase
MTDSFIHKKSLGQHFLKNDFVPKKMCAAASIAPGDTVLEIGPGTGVLTRELLLSGATVIALEADRRAITTLRESFVRELAIGQLTVHEYDARSLDTVALGLENGNYKVVANIPYYLSGFLFRALLASPAQPHTLVFLVQKEVAIRIARAKKESLLSLSVKVFGDPIYVATISRGQFIPPPQVDSAILSVRNISRHRLAGLSEKDFFELLHLGFGQKRKQLLGNLSEHYSREHLTTLFAACGLPPNARAEDVPLAGWIQLSTRLLSPVISTA